MSYNFKGNLAVFFAFISLVFVVSIIAHRTITQNISPVTPGTQIRSNTQSEKMTQKLFENTYFSLMIPSDWVGMGETSIRSAENDLYQISYIVQNRADVKDGEAQKLLDQGKFAEYEAFRFKNACKETGSCGKMEGAEIKNIDGVTTLEFIVNYAGVAVDEPRGNRIEIYRVIFKDGKEYRFWTSETVVPDDLLVRFPRLTPSSSESFREIMKTLKLK